MFRLLVLVILVAIAFAASSPVLAEARAGGLNITVDQGFPWQGFSMFTIVMSLLYAGHVAQDRTSLGWRIVLFVLGFPLTFLASFLVVPGSQRVLGVDLPRHDRPTAETSETSEANAGSPRPEDLPRDRKAERDGVISLLIGLSMVFLFAPTTEYRSQPLDAERFVVEKTVSWGFSETPWLSYRREGVRERDDGPGWTDPEWVTDREWSFDASLEAVLTLFMLLVVFALCVRDEQVRTRALGEHSGDPERTA